MNLEILTLVFRYLYYVKGQSPLPDIEYDALEKAALKLYPNSVELNKPGSDRESDYALKIISLAYHIRQSIL